MHLVCPGCGDAQRFWGRVTFDLPVEADGSYADEPERLFGFRVTGLEDLRCGRCNSRGVCDLTEAWRAFRAGFTCRRHECVRRTACEYYEAERAEGAGVP